jgi:hypothetical protein
MASVLESSPTTLGDKIEALAQLRDRKRELNQELKDVNEEYQMLEAQVLDELDQQGTQFAGSSRHRATISEQTVPSVTDWDAFYDYVRENDALYLFERRVASAPWRELVESGEQVPGTEPFTRRTLSLRKL